MRAGFPLLLLCVCARAAGPKASSCVPAGEPKGKPPALGEIVACQKAELESFAQAYEKKHGEPVPWERLDELGDRQRSEVREYLLRHPESAVVEGVPEAGEGSSDASGPAVPASLSGWLDRLKALAKSMRKRAESFFEKAAPAPGRQSELGYALDGGKEALKAVLDKAKADGVDVEALRRDTLRDPAGTLSRTLKAREKNVENNIDPAMKPFLRPEKTGSPGAPEEE
ncbi:MAG: hypothetical protein AAB576_11745 [Elusimicrobiota bacterium]